MKSAINQTNSLACLLARISTLLTKSQVIALLTNVDVKTNPDRHLFVCTSNQPLEDGIKIGLFLCADSIAAHFAVRDGLQV